MISPVTRKKLINNNQPSTLYREEEKNTQINLPSNPTTHESTLNIAQNNKADRVG